MLKVGVENGMENNLKSSLVPVSSSRAFFVMKNGDAIRMKNFSLWANFSNFITVSL